MSLVRPWLMTNRRDFHFGDNDLVLYHSLLSTANRHTIILRRCNPRCRCPPRAPQNVCDYIKCPIWNSNSKATTIAALSFPYHTRHVTQDPWLGKLIWMLYCGDKNEHTFGNSISMPSIFICTETRAIGWIMEKNEEQIEKWGILPRSS